MYVDGWLVYVCDLYSSFFNFIFVIHRFCSLTYCSLCFKFSVLKVYCFYFFVYNKMIFSEYIFTSHRVFSIIIRIKTQRGCPRCRACRHAHRVFSIIIRIKTVSMMKLFISNYGSHRVFSIIIRIKTPLSFVKNTILFILIEYFPL